MITLQQLETVSIFGAQGREVPFESLKSMLIYTIESIKAVGGP